MQKHFRNIATLFEIYISMRNCQVLLGFFLTIIVTNFMVGQKI